MATTLRATKGRLIRCTVSGLTPNLAAIWRTPGLPGVARASRIRFSRAGAIGGHPRRFPASLSRVRRHGVVPESSPPFTASPEAGDHAVLERAGSCQAANSGRADVEQPGNVGLRLALGDALQRLGALMRCELARPAEAHTALLGPLTALARPSADQLTLELGQASEIHLLRMSIARRMLVLRARRSGVRNSGLALFRRAGPCRSRNSARPRSVPCCPRADVPRPGDRKVRRGLRRTVGPAISTCGASRSAWQVVGRVRRRELHRGFFGLAVPPVSSNEPALAHSVFFEAFYVRQRQLFEGFRQHRRALNLVRPARIAHRASALGNAELQPPRSLESKSRARRHQRS